MKREHALRINNLTKSYNNHTPVLQNLSFSIYANEVAALIGPSGSGKTTLLRTIAGFEDAHSGEIYIGNTQVLGNKIMLSPARRSVGVVFQEHALFPHRTIRANIEFGVRRPANPQWIDHLMNLFDISHLANRYPHQISGGQTQRVGIARALAPRPKLLLLDEPFNNLDTSLRESILDEVRTVLKHFNTAALCITHVPHEAFAIADRIAVLDKGAIVQYCHARQLYREPVDKYVAQFFGPINALPAQYHNSQLILANTQAIALSTEQKTHLALNNANKDNIELLIRPGDIELFPTNSEVYCNRRDMLLLKGKVISTRYYGYYQLVHISNVFHDHTVRVHTDPYMTVRKGQKVQIGLPLWKMQIQEVASV